MTIELCVSAVKQRQFVNLDTLYQKAVGWANVEWSDGRLVGSSGSWVRDLEGFVLPLRYRMPRRNLPGLFPHWSGGEKDLEHENKSPSVPPAKNRGICDLSRGKQNRERQSALCPPFPSTALRTRVRGDVASHHASRISRSSRQFQSRDDLRRGIRYLL